MANANKTRTRILSVVGTLAALGGIYFIYQYLTYVTTDNAQIEAHSLMMAPKVPGYVTAVNVVEGQKVKKDDVLVEIDSRDYQNTLDQVQGELTSIEARRNDAEKNYKRVKDLYSKGVVSQQQFDTSTTGYSEVRAKYDAISAQVSQAQLNLANTKIKAPMDGYIAKKSVEIGQLASAGVPLIGFVGANDRWVVANFKETQIEDIKVGAKVEIAVDAISRKRFTGHVESLSSATGATFTLLPPDNATGNFTKVVQRVPVRIKIDNLSEDDVELLKAGLSADIKIHKH